MPLTWLKKPDVVFAGKGGMVEQSDIIRKRTVYARWERQEKGQGEGRREQKGTTRNPGARNQESGEVRKVTIS
jgi:hypothetical protein